MTKNGTLKRLRVLSIILLCISVPLLVLGIDGLVSNNPAISLFGATIACLVIGAVCAYANFFLLFFVWVIPLVTKANLAVQQEVLNANKERMKDIADTNADIAIDATAKLTKANVNAAREVLQNLQRHDDIVAMRDKLLNGDANEKGDSTLATDTKFCRYCGAKIPADSEFCPKCGKDI